MAVTVLDRVVGEAWGCWLGGPKVCWVDSGSVELMAWGRHLESVGPWDCWLRDLKVSLVDSGSVGLNAWGLERHLESVGPWDCWLRDLKVS